MSQDKQTWSNARQKCQAMAGHLVDLNTRDEIAVVRSKLPSTRTSSYWTGLSKSDGVWKWTDESSAIFTSWAIGEPSGEGDCVSFDHLINNNGPYPWNDQSCYAIHKYVCEIPSKYVYLILCDPQNLCQIPSKYVYLMLCTHKYVYVKIDQLVKSGSQNKKEIVASC